MRYAAQKEIVATFMRRLYTQGLTTCSGGNISMRVDETMVLLTPSALDKGTIQAEQIGEMSLEGENFTPHLKPSIEARMHLALYQARPEINAVVHAHPALSSSFAVSAVPINCELIAESRAILGTPVVAPYALMGTEDLAQSVATAARQGDVVLMANHGVLTVGLTMLQAFDRIEVLEAAARITLVSRFLGQPSALHPTQLAQIDALMGR
jgi:L-fuculose-phosphate aldolase